MSLMLHSCCTESAPSNAITLDIINHPSWVGNMSGLGAEKMLKGKVPFEFVLRNGEHENDYYVTFVMADSSIKHQPFAILCSSEGWHFENGSGGGPFTDAVSIDDVLHLIMHCHKNECVPYTCE